VLFIECSGWRFYFADKEIAMTQDTKQPRTPKEQKPPRPSHERVVENLDKWANSPGLQPPK
jgi:hypothetical protein